jgi:UDP-glucose 4-epimerase
MKAGVKKLIILSAAEVYGYRPSNPFYLDENAPLRPTPHDMYLQDKVELDEYCRDVLMRHPDISMTILRPAFCAGPGISSRLTQILCSAGPGLIPAGYNPHFQFIHIDDMVRAIVYSMLIDARGVYNIAGDGIVSLAQIMNMTRRIFVRVPAPVLYNYTNARWYLRLSPIPAAMTRLLKYSIIVSTKKAEKDLVFFPRMTSKDAFESYIADKKLRAYMKKPEQPGYLSARTIIRDYSRSIEEDEIEKVRLVIRSARSGSNELNNGVHTTVEDSSIVTDS